MNEPLKFRGFNYKQKKLVTGYYFVNRGRHFIANDELVSLAAQADDFAVDPVTVGMSTGRVDANGREIFEFDILAPAFRPLRPEPLGFCGCARRAPDWPVHQPRPAARTRADGRGRRHHHYARGLQQRTRKLRLSSRRPLKGVLSKAVLPGGAPLFFLRKRKT